MAAEHTIDVGYGYHVVVNVYDDTSVRVRLADHNHDTVWRGDLGYERSLSFATDYLDGRTK